MYIRQKRNYFRLYLFTIPANLLLGLNTLILSKDPVNSIWYITSIVVKNKHFFKPNERWYNVEFSKSYNKFWKFVQNISHLKSVKNQ
jgi:hypothetical protein